MKMFFLTKVEAYKSIFDIIECFIIQSCHTKNVFRTSLSSSVSDIPNTYTTLGGHFYNDRLFVYKKCTLEQHSTTIAICIIIDL